MSSQPRFLLIKGKLTSTFPLWILISSSDKVATFHYPSYLDGLIKNGTCRSNNFGHSGNLGPEKVVLLYTKNGAEVENHGFFRSLKDVHAYISTDMLLD